MLYLLFNSAQEIHSSMICIENQQLFNNDGEKTYFTVYICDRLCENPPCLHILHCLTKIGVKF